jgi:predicted RNase H-like HicB family nuclease
MELSRGDRGADLPYGSTPMRYAIVIEKAEGNYSACVPDLPGCIATASTVEAVETEIRHAIRFHVVGLRDDGLQSLIPVSFMPNSQDRCPAKQL